MQHKTTTYTQVINPHFNPANTKRGNLTVHQTPRKEGFLDVASLAGVNEHARLTLTTFFVESKILKNLFHPLMPVGNLYLYDRIVLKFSLSDDFANHFILLRGLLCFGKPPHVLVVAEPADRTFTIEVTSVYAENVIVYFREIFTWLAKEIKFKVALREVIRLQREAQKIQQEAFEGLYASVS